MDLQLRVLLILLIFKSICNSYFLVYCKVVMQRLENCDDDNAKYKVIFNSTFKTVGDIQYTNVTIILTAPVDNSLKANTSVEILVGHEYVYLFSIHEKKACDSLNKYFGEMWYDMEKHLGMIPRQCPISQGRYHVHNYLMDWDRMPTLQSFPFGNLRVNLVGYDSKNTIFTCFVLELSNTI